MNCQIMTTVHGKTFMTETDACLPFAGRKKLDGNELGSPVAAPNSVQRSLLCSKMIDGGLTFTFSPTPLGSSQ